MLSPELMIKLLEERLGGVFFLVDVYSMHVGGCGSISSDSYLSGCLDTATHQAGRIKWSSERGGVLKDHGLAVSEC